MKQVELFNVLGQCSASNIIDNGSSAEISLESLPAGIYLLKVQMDNGTTDVKKIVKH